MAPTRKDLHATHRPPGAVPTACANCGSEATRAVYQHSHEAVVTWEIPAYSGRKDQAPVKWKCPLCGDKCDAVLVKCGNCGCVATVDNAHGRVNPPKPSAPIQK